METETPMHRCPRCGGKMRTNEKHSCVSSSGKTDAKSDESSDLHEQRIRARAYELYLGRGREDGHAVEDWAQAEKELRGQGKSEKRC